MLFHDIFAHHPKEREAIIDQDRSVTYGEFQDLVGAGPLISKP